jgi:hypothetical protein
MLWEDTVSVLNKIVYVYMCPIPNGFWDRSISLYRPATYHVITQVAKVIDVGRIC